MSSMDADPELRATWLRLMSLFVERRDATFELLHEHGITPPQSHAMSLLLEGPAKMRDLAEHMRCDASYITAVTDRLEELGLAERRPSPGDRRVREVVLTAEGLRVAAAVRDSFSAPPSALSRLRAADRRELARLCELMVPDVDAASDPLRAPTRRPAPAG